MEENIAVFTTSQVLEGKPILYVYHDMDGEWQFHSEFSPDINDIKIVALNQIAMIDNSVNELFDLQCGWNAWREGPNDVWKRKKE